MNLRTFKNGVHPPENKVLSEKQTIESLPLSKEVFIPLNQHIGAPCKPVVEKRDEVKTGQVIGERDGFVSSQVHATVSGKIKAIDTFMHPLGIPAKMIQITSDGKDNWVTGKPSDKEWSELDTDEIIKRISAAGIVGLGGAAFPTQVKLSPPKDKPIDTFILNGCECEPYLTADYRMMLEQTDEMITGMRIIMQVLSVEQGMIGIESNKPDAIKKLMQATAAHDDISVIPLKVKYPQGAEKMLIKAVLNRAVPAGGLPMDVGVVVNNVGTAIAIAGAVEKKKPLVQRVVTVTGEGIQHPKNLMIRIGTPFQDVIDFCGGLTHNANRVIMGGPMMGLTQDSLAVPVIKATSGILCLTDQTPISTPEFACIQCGNCVHHCPLNLLPTRIARAVEYEKYIMAEELGALNCIECGCCAFICPSNIPLVQRIRIGKLRINEMNKG